MNQQSIRRRRYEMLPRFGNTVFNLLAALALYSMKDDFRSYSAAIAASFWGAPWRFAGADDMDFSLSTDIAIC
jgi:hypothetical protein